MPHVEPVRVIHLPTQSTIPRFEVAGPVIAGDLAIVASSQFGFTALDYRTGTIAWTMPQSCASFALIARPFRIRSTMRE